MDAGTGESGASDGAAGEDSAGDSGGSTNCAGNAISLSANGTGTDSDAAQAQVVIDLMSDLPIGDADRTIEFWAYIQPTDWIGERNEIYVYGGPGTSATAFGLDFGTNPVDGMPGNHATLNPITNGGFNVDSTAYLGITSASAQWVHIAMSWDGTTMRTYVNGTPRITSTGSAGITMLSTAASPITLGCNPANMGCYSGMFDDLRVWNVARSDAEIMGNYTRLLAGNETGLVGYWKFDEAPGSASAADSVTTVGHTAHDGMLMATTAAELPTFVTPTPPAPIVCP